MKCWQLDLDLSDFPTNTTHANTCIPPKKFCPLSNLPPKLDTTAILFFHHIQSFPYHNPSAYSATLSLVPTSLEPCQSIVKINTRHFTHTYAITNLETMDVDPPLAVTQVSTTSKKCTAIEAEISGGKTEPAISTKAKCGCLAGSKNKPKVVQDPKMVNNTRKGVDLLPEKHPAIKNVITQPQPI